MESSYILVNDIRVHYLKGEKAPNESRPVVLQHGLASNARIWDLVAPHLEENGLKPYAPDARGHGLTDKPDGDYGFEPFHQDLACFIQTCNWDHPLLVGHSWGANLVLNYASKMVIGQYAPSGIVLVDGGMSQMNAVPNATWEATRDRLTPPRLKGMRLSDFLGRMQNHQRSWIPDDQIIPIILANFEISADETIAPHLSFEHHMQIVQAMWEFKTYEILQSVRCPILMLPAIPPSPVSPQEQEYLKVKEIGIEKAKESGAPVQVHWMRDTIHDIPLQRPKELAQLIVDFSNSLAV